MKKLLLVLCVAILSFNVYAHGSLQVDLLGEVSWTPVNISIFPIHLFSPLHTDVRGVYLAPGLVGLAPNIYGVSCGILIVTKEKSCGIAANVFSLSQEHYGISLGLINLFDRGNGLSVGIVNLMTYNNGVSVGVVNSAPNNIFQLGLFNSSESGLQIGLLNYNPKSYIPWLPLVNWDMGREEK